MAHLQPPTDSDDWIALCRSPLPTGAALEWATVAGCGGVVVFAGTVRDHADGREGVTALEYEAYEGPAGDRLRALAAEARRRWSDVGRIALLHRVGRLAVTETAVVVVVSAPHRDAAFDAARWCIDTLKATAPIWKKEEWLDGSSWGTRATPVADMFSEAVSPRRRSA